MSVVLKRLKNASEIIADFNLRTIDNPAYALFHMTDWYGGDIKINGWDYDAFFAVKGEEILGFVKWFMNREDNRISGVAVAVEKQCLNSGLGARILASWIEYIFTKRSFRKINFEVSDWNKSALHLYRKTPGIREVGTLYAHRKTAIGHFHDMVSFEILKDNYLKQSNGKYKKFKLLEFKDM